MKSLHSLTIEVVGPTETELRAAQYIRDVVGENTRFYIDPTQKYDLGRLWYNGVLNHWQHVGMTHERRYAELYVQLGRVSHELNWVRTKE